MTSTPVSHTNLNFTSEMKRLIIIEDRSVRQQNFLNSGFDLSGFQSLNNICGGIEFTSFKSDISNQKFDKQLCNFNAIAIHRSAISTEEKNNLLEYCKTKGKDLIFFSGGISSVLIQKINNNYLLTINSKEFYSKNLIEYLNNSNVNLLILAFGENWQLNLLSGLLDKLLKYLQSSEEKFEFQELTDLNDWEKKEFFKDLSDDSTLEKSDFKKVISQINAKIRTFI